MQPVELPDFCATWWPLQMETIPGSGERLTVAVMARAASGQTQVRQSIAPPALTSMFGVDTGRGVQAMIGSTVIDLQRQLDAGVPPEHLQLPLGGFAFAHARDCVARDLNEVFDIAVRLTAAFGQSPFGRHTEASDSARRAFQDWADRVQAELLDHDLRIELTERDFNVRMQLARKAVRFGFVKPGYAANFGVLRPGHTAGDMRSLKVKVFDLEALRRDDAWALTHADVLVACPRRDALTGYTRREVDSYYTSLEFIQVEAAARRVALVCCNAAAEAADHIRQRIAA